MGLPPIPSGSDQQVSTYTVGSPSFPTVASLVDGGFVVSWVSDAQDGESGAVFAQRYDVNGSPVGSEFQVSTSPNLSQNYPTVTGLGGGGFLIAWWSVHHSQDNVAQRYSANGDAIGAEFRINTFTRGSQNFPSVTSLAEGGFVMTWHSQNQDDSSWSIYGQLYDESGDHVGQEFKFKSKINNSDIFPSATALANGDFLVTWEAWAQNGSGWSIYGQKFDSNGNPVGDDFHINTSISVDHISSSVAAFVDGGYVVTWSSRRQSGSSVRIYGQRYKSDGKTLGDEFAINSRASGDQFYPSVTALADRGFVVTWSSYGGDASHSGIYGQRFDADGHSMGSEFQLNNTIAGSQGTNSV